MEFLLVEGGTIPTAPSRSRLSNAGWICAGVVAVAALVVSFIHFRETLPREQTLRYTIGAPENSTVHSFAISPDGRALVVAAAVNGKPQLWLRPMDALQAQPMASTEDATYPFWSPDSRTIGFFAQGKLKKIAASGGPAQSLCAAPDGRGGSWSRDDVIVFAPNGTGSPIQRVAAAGGVPVDATKARDRVKNPVFLPDGRHFLYISVNGTPEQNGIYVSSLDGKENRRILADLSTVVFAPPARGGRTGYILFARENTLMAAPFDAAGAQVSGDVFPVAEGVSPTTNGNYVRVTAAENGVLLYEVNGERGGTNQLGWYDRSGKSPGPVGAPGPVFEPAISPDEKSVVFRRDTLGASGSDLWVRDLSRGTETRFTSNPTFNAMPVWSPRGDRIVFASNRKGGAYNLYQKAASGSGQDELLLPNNVGDAPTQWSRDGRFIVYFEQNVKTKFDLWVLPTEGAAPDAKAGRKPIPFLRTEFNELFGQLSPDSHWMAFTSDRSGQREVYVRPFPPADGEWTISIAGGEQPRWRGDGKEMFFEAADGKMMAVPVKAAAGTKSSFEVGTPVALFDAHMARNTNNVSLGYDVTADGKRFLIDMTSGTGATSSPPLTVVTNWNAGLKK
jgi:Tol biopolymer transport system component